MKKHTTIFIAAALLSTFALSGCEDNSRWNTRNPDLPASFFETQQKLLDEAQTKLTNDPRDFTAQFAIGFHNQNIGNLKAAVAAYEKALVIKPTDYVTLNNLAASYEEAKDYPNAAKYVKKLYESAPDNAEAIRDTVRILLLNNEPEPATKALENYVKVLREANKADQSTIVMVSELYQSIDAYKKQHDKK